MGRNKGAKYRFPLQDGTCDFPGDAVAGKGLILCAAERCFVKWALWGEWVLLGPQGAVWPCEAGDSGPSEEDGYYWGHRELPGPARQVTLPCTWHFRLSSSILSQKRLEFVVCVSQLGGPSAEQSPKTATPHGTPCGSSSLCLPLAFSFGS